MENDDVGDKILNQVSFEEARKYLGKTAEAALESNRGTFCLMQGPIVVGSIERKTFFLLLQNLPFKMDRALGHNTFTPIKRYD